MNFFEHQAQAHQWTSRLVLLFSAAVIVIVIAVNIGVGFAAYIYSAFNDPDVMYGNSILGAVDHRVYIYTTLITLGIIATGSIKRMRDIAGGGKAIAEMIGGRRVDRYTEITAERRLLNIIDEMAIASGISVPAVYILDGQRSINAFAAGFTPNSAAITITSGTLEALSRDELQGVIAHEFSHILNGDMRLNLRLLGILNGIVYIGAGGAYLLRAQHPGLAFVGIILAVAGYTGVFLARLIKSAVSRQREYLADASAVQFTRNPNGIAHALAKIYFLPYRTSVGGRYSEEINHMFFSETASFDMFESMATHPPLTERIKRIKPQLDLNELKRNKQEKMKLLNSGNVSPPMINRVFLGDDKPALVTDPTQIVDSIGNPSVMHLAYAMALLETMPATLLKTMETCEGTQAVIYAITIDKDMFQQQFSWLEENIYDELVDQVKQLWPLINKLDKRYRLPLLDIGLPVLRTMTQEQKNQFVANIKTLIKLDKKITLGEYVVHTLLHQQLSEKAEQAVRIRFTDITPVIPECVLLLSLFSHIGSGDKAAIEQAYSRGAQALMLTDTKLLDKTFIKLKDVKSTLTTLRQVAFRSRKQLISACAATVMADGQVRTGEAEFLRSVVEVLECPMPPLLGQQALKSENPEIDGKKTG